MRGDPFQDTSSLGRERKSFDYRTQKPPVQQHGMQTNIKPSTKRSFNVNEDPLPSNKKLMSTSRSVRTPIAGER
jgi:hypothetical protein